MRALVIGAGVGGLSAAVALRRIGVEVTIFERSGEVGEIGAGLSLWPNALRASRELDIYEAVMVVSNPLRPKAEAMKRRLQRVVADDRWLREGEPEGFWTPVFTPVAIPDGVRGFSRGYQGAESFRKRHGLGASPIADVAILADEVGVVVARMPLGDEPGSPDGCSAVDPETGAAYVLINSDKPRVRRRFTIAHELGRFRPRPFSPRPSSCHCRWRRSLRCSAPPTRRSRFPPEPGSSGCPADRRWSP